MSNEGLVIDGIPFQNALIIDNKPADVKSLEDDLKKKNISVVLTTNSTEAESLLTLRPEFSLVILDWLLDEENDIEARHILKLMKLHTFAPLIIYTDKGREIPDKYVEEEGLKRIAIVLEKATVKGDTVFSEMANWLASNPELRIFLRWAHETRKRLNETLWTIHDLEIGGIRALTELLREPEETAHVPHEQDLVNFFGRVLTRKLGNDDEFLRSIKTDIEKLVEARKNVKVDLDKLKTFHGFERYKTEPRGTLWTGSILKNQKNQYFVIATPSCDLCHPDKIEKILLIRAESLTDYRKTRFLKIEAGMSHNKIDSLTNIVKSCITNNTDSVHFLPYAVGLPDGLVCRFDRILSVDQNVLKKTLEEGKWHCVQTIDSPFVENLVQRMNAYLMRIGVRDLSKKEVKKIFEDSG